VAPVIKDTEPVEEERVKVPKSASELIQTVLMTPPMLSMQSSASPYVKLHAIVMIIIFLRE
jgi:hypothetical protein